MSQQPAPPPPPPPPLLQVDSISKRFPGVRALHEVSLTLNRGEVLSVIGENGAGKSTLMKILAGIQQPDSGAIVIDGQRCRIESVQRAFELGIALIHQELNLADNLSIGANLFLGREPRRHGGLIDQQAIDRQSREVLKRVKLELDPATIVERLPIGQQQLVEIARALAVDARVLIMDEPTSSLSAHEAATLFDVVHDLRRQGVSVIYISHRLGEVRELSDRVTVLRDGENVGELTGAEASHDRMVQMMVGRDVSEFYDRRPHPPGEVVLAVEDLVTAEHPHESLSFDLRAGEIVGVAGLVGAGRTEMLRAIFGVTPPVSGTVQVGGVSARVRSPQDAIRLGLALVPEDRKLQGLVLEMTVRENMGLAGLWANRIGPGLLNQVKETRTADEMIARLRVRTPGPEQIAQYLSGGNQQKVVLGKWLALKPRVLLLDEPTRGIDVGAKQEIYRLMEQLAAEGVGILFVSSEMEEIIGMSDRTLVMHEGRITGQLLRAELSEEAILQLATGAQPTSAA